MIMLVEYFSNKKTKQKLTYFMKTFFCVPVSFAQNPGGGGHWPIMPQSTVAFELNAWRCHRPVDS